MLVWVFQTGEPLPSDDGNFRPMRAINISNMLLRKGHKVVLWSTAFFHQKKIHRSNEFKVIKISDNFEIRLIPSPGYRKNISFNRFYDHCILAYNLYKKLQSTNEKPDVGFIGFPPIEAAYVFTKWLKENNIPSLIDVKDQWPTIIVDSLPSPLRVFGKIMLYPYYYMAKKAMHFSTGVCAHSKGFLDWSIMFSQRNQTNQDIIVPLSVPDEKPNIKDSKDAKLWWKNIQINSKRKFRVMFVGSLSRSFDFDPIFESSHNLKKQNINCEFVICGEGEKFNSLKTKSKNFDNIKIIKWIDKAKIETLAKISDATIAPYKNSSDLIISIPNKIIDSLRLGLPILSPLKGELEVLIKENRIGLTYGGDSSLSDCIKTIINQPTRLESMSKNSRILYNKKFQYQKVYDGVVTHLEELTKRI